MEHKGIEGHGLGHKKLVAAVVMVAVASALYI
jgi:hypothetical protein